jgi:type IV secretion system protein VirD4
VSEWFGWVALGAVVIIALLVTLVVARSERRDADAAWDAGFAAADKTGLVGNADGIYVGIGKDTKGRDRELLYPGDRHIMTFGPNGSGKSKRLLYENLKRLKDWSIVVVDPKGELARDTLDIRRRMGSEIIVLDPFRVSGFDDDGHNPIAALSEGDDFPDDAMALAEAIIRIDPGRDSHWPASAQDLVAAFIMSERLASSYFDGDPEHEVELNSFGTVRQNLTQAHGAFRDLITAMLGVADNVGYPELRAKAARFADIDEDSKELHSIISTALTQTRWLDSRPIKNSLTTPRAQDFRVLKERPTTVYLVLPPHRLVSHSLWLRLMITSILQPLLKDTNTASVPVLLMLDEYPALAEGDGFPVIARNMAMLRGYNVKLWTVWQDLTQAQRVYNRNWETFASNAGVLQAFQPQDLTTADYLSKRTGITAREISNWSWAGKQPSVSGSQQGMPLMLPQAVRALDEGQTLIFTHVAKGPVRAYLPFPPELARPTEPPAGHATIKAAATRALLRRRVPLSAP